VFVNSRLPPPAGRDKWGTRCPCAYLLLSATPCAAGGQNVAAINCWARRSATAEEERESAIGQIITILASASIRLSAPKSTSATNPQRRPP
jgi:hypothetical protein